MVRRGTYSIVAHDPEDLLVGRIHAREVRDVHVEDLAHDVERVLDRLGDMGP